MCMGFLISYVQLYGCLVILWIHKIKMYQTATNKFENKYNDDFVLGCYKNVWYMFDLHNWWRLGSWDLLNYFLFKV